MITKDACQRCIKVAGEMGENRIRAAVVNELRDPQNWLLDAVVVKLGDDYDMPAWQLEHFARKVFLAIADKLDIDTSLSLDLSADEARLLAGPHS